MNIDGFMNVAKGYALNKQSDEMIVGDGRNGTRASGKLGGKVTRFFRHLFGVGNGANEAIRRDLAKALSAEYGGTLKIPKNVLQALKLDPNAQASLDTDGNLKLGSTPLTARRIVAVMDAVKQNRRVAELTSQLMSCIDRAAEKDEEFARDYHNPHKLALQQSIRQLVESAARKAAARGLFDDSESGLRSFIEDGFKKLGYCSHGDDLASFGLSGAAPKKAVMEALVNDMVNTAEPPVVKRNRDIAVNQLVDWCQTEMSNLDRKILDLTQKVADLKKQEMTPVIRDRLETAKANLKIAKDGLQAIRKNCGETPETQKAWARRYLEESPQITRYFNTTISSAKLNELKNSYLEALKRDMAAGLKVYVQNSGKPTGFSGNFLREITAKRTKMFLINGSAPRSVRKNPDVDLGHAQAGNLESYKSSEEIKALVEQLAEVIPDMGVRQFVTSAISENGFAMMLGTELMNVDKAPLNEIYTNSPDNTLKDDMLVAGTNLNETKISINVDQDGTIDIRLRGGPAVSYMGKSPLTGEGMSKTLFDIPFESHIRIPGGQHVQPGEMPEVAVELNLVQE